MASILSLNDKVNFRDKYNTKILNELHDLLKAYPDLRFGQALINLGICKDTSELWNKESIDIYSNMKHLK